MSSVFPLDDVSSSDTSEVAAWSVYSIGTRGAALEGIEGIEILIAAPPDEERGWEKEGNGSRESEEREEEQGRKTESPRGGLVSFTGFDAQGWKKYNRPSGV